MKNDTDEQMGEVCHRMPITRVVDLFTDARRYDLQTKDGIKENHKILSVGVEFDNDDLMLGIYCLCPLDDMPGGGPGSVMRDVTEQSVHQQNVERFMVLAGQEVPDIPTIPSEDVRRLRARLTLEEALEQIKALGFEPMLHGVQLTMEGVEFDHDPDLISLPEIIDGACDLRVIATGTLSACGVCDQVPQELVDESNLNKFGEGGYRREDGKWMKPADWTPPDWEAEIKRQSERVGDE